VKNPFKIAVAIAAMSLCSCLNMPTPPSQITATHVSGVLYSKLDLESLEVELDSLSRREAALVVAQEQRKRTSETQAFWYGYGQGDGIEASELAHVRGQIEAVRKTIEQKRSAPEKPELKNLSSTPDAYEKALNLARIYKKAGMTYAQSATAIGANADANGANAGDKAETLRVFERAARDSGTWPDELENSTTNTPED